MEGGGKEREKGDKEEGGDFHFCVFVGRRMEGVLLGA